MMVCNETRREAWSFHLDHIRGFLIIGIITTGVDIGLLYLLTEEGHLWYLLSAALSYSTGAILSYTLNKRLIFRNESQEYLIQGSVFLLIASCCMLLSLLIIFIGVEMLGLSYITAKLFATGIAFIWNYLGQTSVTFRFWR